MKKVSIALILVWGLSQPGFSQKVRVAIAANVQSVMKVLQADFLKRTGIEIETISGASGNLATQIRNGAPFDLFLSADMVIPESLFQEGLCYEKAKVYAQGSLILCSHNLDDLRNWKTLILTEKVKKIAIANPQIAPYGKAAVESLNYYKLYKSIKEKLVQGESISQVNTYILTGVVSLGFTARSFMVESVSSQPLYWVSIPPNSYTPIDQGLVILKHAEGENRISAQKLFNYLLSSPAKLIFKAYGYSEK